MSNAADSPPVSSARTCHLLRLDSPLAHLSTSLSRASRVLNSVCAGRSGIGTRSGGATGSGSTVTGLREGGSQAISLSRSARAPESAQEETPNLFKILDMIEKARNARIKGADEANPVGEIGLFSHIRSSLFHCGSRGIVEAQFLPKVCFMRRQ